MTTENIDAALARAQATFGAIGKAKSADAGKYAYKYADLAAVFAEIRPKLAAEGIAISQPIRVTDNGMVLVTQLRHAGEVLESEVELPIADASPQEVGSLLSYYRRYAVCSLAGVQPEDEDDDGAAAQQSVSHGSRGRPVASQANPKPASPKQVGFAQKLLNEVVAPPLTLTYIEEATGRSAQLEDLFTFEMSKLIDKLQDDKKAGVTPETTVPEGEAFLREPSGGPSPTHRQTPE